MGYALPPAPRRMDAGSPAPRSVTSPGRNKILEVEYGTPKPPQEIFVNGELELVDGKPPKRKRWWRRNG